MFTCVWMILELTVMSMAYFGGVGYAVHAWSRGADRQDEAKIEKRKR